MSENANYGLLVAFTDDSQSFTNGFEAGQIWQDMRGGGVAEIENRTIHAGNEEVVRRMAVAEGWEIESRECKDENGRVYDMYRVVTLRKTKQAAHNPHGLRVVK